MDVVEQPWYHGVQGPPMHLEADLPGEGCER
jgi:hypothetical protein